MSWRVLELMFRHRHFSLGCCIKVVRPIVLSLSKDEAHPDQIPGSHLRMKKLESCRIKTSFMLRCEAQQRAALKYVGQLGNRSCKRPWCYTTARFIKAHVAISGSDRPCSQALSVESGTPQRDANSVCVSINCNRSLFIFATGRADKSSASVQGRSERLFSSSANGQCVSVIGAVRCRLMPSRDCG
jgi:hypothetical protein